MKIALTQQDSGFENGKDVGCGMKSESQLWFDDIMKISLSEKPHMRSIPLSPKAADYHLDIPPKVVLKRNGRFATAAKQSIKIQFAESNDRHRRKVTILISNTTNADATWKLIPIGKAYLEREQKKLPLTDEIFKFSILTGRVTSGEQFFCSLSFTPLMPGRFMQTWHLRVNNHTIPVYIDAIIIVNRKPSRILRPSSAHPYIDPTLNIERTKAEPRELPISNLAVSGKNDIEMVDRREMLMRIISDTAPAVPIYDNLAELPKAAIPGWIEMKDVHIPKQPRKKALSSLNFGAVRLFESKTISFKIANPSTNTAQVELTVTGPFRLPAMYVSIRARSFITIPIKYTPETLGGTHDRLLVLKDSQLERVDLIGCGI